MQHRSRSILGAAASLTLLVGLAACGSDDKASTTTAERTTTSKDDADPTTTTRRATTTEATGDSTDVTEPDDDEVSTTAEDEGVTTSTSDTDGGDVDTSDWVTYDSDAGYSADFPSEPTSQSQSAPLPDGSSITLTIVSSQQGQVFYATASGEYPAPPADVDAALEGAQDQAVKNVNGTLIDSSDITVDGRPGRQFSAAVTQGGQDGTVVQRVVLDGAKLYQSIVVAPKDLTATTPEVAAFFDSFTLTG